MKHTKVLDFYPKKKSKLPATFFFFPDKTIETSYERNPKSLFRILTELNRVGKNLISITMKTKKESKNWNELFDNKLQKSEMFLIRGGGEPPDGPIDK